MNIDLSNAPRGATHWDPVDQNWLKQSIKAFNWNIHNGWIEKGWQYPDDLSTMSRLIALEPCADADGLPPLESIVRILPGDTTIWDVAEQFVGVDCRLKAVFMLDETQMVAVECIESGQCCCFWASMVRTPEQAKTEERKAAIDKMIGDAKIDFGAGELMSAREYVECAIAALHDAGYRKQVAP